MEYHSGEGVKVKRQRVEQAIQLALQSKWSEAAAANRMIISMFPADVDAFNRLGKALTEMGEYEEARRSYERALDLEPGNAIARKNLERIDALGPETPRAKASNLDPALFIAHTGKAGIASVNGVKGELSARLTAGDILSTKAKGGKVVVSTVAGEVLGEVEPKIAVRLVRLMEGGNKYEAAVAGLPNGVLRIVIRETYQHPSQTGKVSFPAPNGGETVRPYVKERLLRHDLEEDTTQEPDETEDWDQDVVAGEGDISLQDYQEAVEGEGSDDDEPEE